MKYHWFYKYELLFIYYHYTMASLLTEPDNPSVREFTRLLQENSECLFLDSLVYHVY